MVQNAFWHLPVHDIPEFAHVRCPLKISKQNISKSDTIVGTHVNTSHIFRVEVTFLWPGRDRRAQEQNR